MLKRKPKPAKSCDKQKIDRVIGFLCDDDVLGEGYSNACQWIGDSLAVASLDHDNEPTLHVYGRQELLAWHDNAASFMRATGSTFAESMYETK